jgi:hypothetical protein
MGLPMNYGAFPVMRAIKNIMGLILRHVFVLSVSMQYTPYNIFPVQSAYVVSTQARLHHT